MTRALLPAVLLAAYALAFGRTTLAGGLLVFDDHPGQIYRLYHAVTIGWAPWRMNPGWWAGYAELQYYPPGAAWLGAVIHNASLGTLGVPQSYEAVLWIAWVLPGLTTFALLTRVLGSGWLALPGAFVALTLSAGSRSGVEEGLRWGLVSARLGWGLLPLVALSLVGWVEAARRTPLLATPLIAAVILLHPAHAPAALVILILGACLGEGDRWRRMAQAGIVGALGLGLSAVWLLPLLVHLRMALPLAWGDSSALGLLQQFGVRPLIIVLALAQVAAWISMRRAGTGGPTERWLHAFTPAMIVAVALDALAAAPLGLLWLPADRLADSLLLALILGASLAAPLVAARSPLLGPVRTGIACVGAAILLSGGSPEPALTLWPTRGEWPKYEAVVRGTRMDALWQALSQAPPGRVLFLRSAIPLDYRPEWWRPHSHISALTPVETGRGILNGTFTHPSPIAGLVYTGSADPRPVSALVEERDGVTLFGHRLESLSPAEFSRWAERLRISAVVAAQEDRGRLPFLDSNQDFGPPRIVGPFVLYPTRVPRLLPQPAGFQAWSLTPGRQDAGWIPVAFAYSPLWRAVSGSVPLPIRRDSTGMLEVETPADVAQIVLYHGPGTVERAGVAITAASAILLGVGLVRRHGTRISGGATRAIG